jgi:hypothetical protein
MRSRTLRATGLGSTSFESDKTVTLSPRLELDFDCPAQHHFTVVFSLEAQLPTSWACPTCWASAARSDGVQAEAKQLQPARTHWDRLLERRSVAELEALLAERLALIKAGVIGPNAYEQIATAGKRKAA